MARVERRSQLNPVFGGRWDHDLGMKTWTDYMRATSAMGSRDYDAAASSCRRILLHDPEDSFAMTMLAHCSAAQGRPAEALDWSEQALARVPDSFVMLQFAANLCASRGDHARAKELVMRALAADPHQHDLPPWLLSFLHTLVRVPVVRGFVRPEAVVELDPSTTERNAEQWRQWAREYLAWLATQGLEA